MERCHFPSQPDLEAAARACVALWWTAPNSGSTTATAVRGSAQPRSSVAAAMETSSSPLPAPHSALPALPAPRLAPSMVGSHPTLGPGTALSMTRQLHHHAADRNRIARCRARPNEWSVRCALHSTPSAMHPGTCRSPAKRWLWQRCSRISLARSVLSEGCSWRQMMARLHLAASAARCCDQMQSLGDMLRRAPRDRSVRSPRSPRLRRPARRAASTARRGRAPPPRPR